MFEKRFFSAPFQVCFAITKRCNLRCKHCCTEVSLDGDELTFNEILDIIDQFRIAKIFSIQVLGGEPLLRKEVFQILKILKEKRFGISLNTNCTLINDKTIREFKKVFPIGLCTSLDGSRAEIHDKLRGEGSFEKAVEGMKRLIKEGFQLSAEAVVTKYNIEDLPQIAKTARKIGLSRMVFVPIFYGGRAKCFQSDLAPDDETYKIGRAIAKELIDKYPKFTSGAFIDGFIKIEQFKTLKKKKNQKVAKIGLCGAGRMTLGIRSDGIVIPCSALWDMPAGSVREKPLMEIWNNSPVLRQFRTIDKDSLDSIEECRICNYKYFCNGNCRASAYYSSGNIKGYSPDCNYFRDDYPFHKQSSKIANQ